MYNLEIQSLKTGNVWNNLCINLGGNWSHDTSFQAKELKNQSEFQTVPALAPKLILKAENKNFEFRPV